MFLTKNDFLLARTCPTKVFYKKLEYPSLLDDDPYLEFLRDGGYIIESIAKLLFPEGKDLGRWTDPKIAFDQTCSVLADGNGTFFEATIIHSNLLARVDILTRQDSELRVVEVKSSSFDSRDGSPPFRGKNGYILSDWREYLEDLTFQVIILRRAFPKFKVTPLLCLVDKAKNATDQTTFDKFRIEKTNQADGYSKPKVDYLGDPSRLREAHQLAFLDTTAEVDELASEVAVAADRLADSIRPDPITRFTPDIGKKCKACEFRVSDNTAPKNGFKECWGNLAETQPHILDLYRIDSLGGKKQDRVAELAKVGKSCLSDINDSDLQGAFAVRQKLQIDCTKTNREFISDELVQKLARHPFPLHFIDFEVSRPGISYREGMRAYELAAFQWSCETFPAPKGNIVHKEWLNSEEAFPNFSFARALKNHIGNSGTVYIWSPFEVSVLKEIRQQLTQYGAADSELAKWLDEMTSEHNPRIVDLCALAKDYYFHPAMKGSLSIKDVLAAAWITNTNLHQNPFFTKYSMRDEDGNVLSPYETLPPLPIGEKDEVVREGTGAMRVYQDMMFGIAKGDSTLRDRYRSLLLQYCELDTKAMVFIWLHWQQKT